MIFTQKVPINCWCLRNLGSFKCMLKQHCQWQMLQKGICNLTRSYAHIILALSHILMIALAWQTLSYQVPPCSLRRWVRWYRSPVLGLRQSSSCYGVAIAPRRLYSGSPTVVAWTFWGFPGGLYCRSLVEEFPSCQSCSPDCNFNFPFTWLKLKVLLQHAGSITS